MFLVNIYIYIYIYLFTRTPLIVLGSLARYNRGFATDIFATQNVVLGFSQTPTSSNKKVNPLQ